jgi:hypothetical protein
VTYLDPAAGSRTQADQMAREEREHQRKADSRKAIMDSNEIENFKSNFAFETVDIVLGDPETTDFKRRARLHQALWREKMNFPIGSQPMLVKPGESARALGSRMELDFAKETGANFLSDRIRLAVADRLLNPQRYQTLNEHRLFGDLLSSMPMCFNLFGTLSADLELANKAVHSWWPDVPGRVCAVRFEWSPGRSIPGLYLENRSAFDVAFELELGNGARGILGVETKYHEDCKSEAIPSLARCNRYSQVTQNSNVFTDNAIGEIIGTDLQQIWLDHLLALSILQEQPQKWVWSKFVFVHPAKNPSYQRATDRYKKYLKCLSSFEVTTIESLLANCVLGEAISSALTDRYIW